VNKLSETPGTRRAALLLHAMGAEDSRWVMARLADEQQQVLRALLEELAELGIPAQPELIREALGEAVPTNPVSQPQVAPAMRSIAALSADAAHSLLHTESEEFIGRLLALAPWAWASEFVHRLPLLKQRGIKEARAAWAAEYEAVGVDLPVDKALLQALAKASEALRQTAAETTNFRHSDEARASKPLLSRLSELARRA
jgi:hypothetical protein